MKKKKDSSEAEMKKLETPFKVMGVAGVLATVSGVTLGVNLFSPVPPGEMAAPVNIAASVALLTFFVLCYLIAFGSLIYILERKEDIHQVKFMPKS